MGRRKAKAVQVALSTNEAEGGLWVMVRAVQDGATYFRAWGGDERAAEYAMLAAERFCMEHGFVRVIAPANDVTPEGDHCAA